MEADGGETRSAKEEPHRAPTLAAEIPLPPETCRARARAATAAADATEAEESCGWGRRRKLRHRALVVVVASVGEKEVARPRGQFQGIN